AALRDAQESSLSLEVYTGGMRTVGIEGQEFLGGLRIAEEAVGEIEASDHALALGSVALGVAIEDVALRLRRKSVLEVFALAGDVAPAVACGQEENRESRFHI